jgi:hypothetical protein
MKGIKVINRGDSGTYLEFTDKNRTYNMGTVGGEFKFDTTITTPSGTLIEEAPIDGVVYARQDAGWIDIPSTESFKGRVFTENTITVHPTDASAAFSTIKEALESITTSSPTNRYSVLVGPGNYVEDNSAAPLDIPSFVSIQATGIRNSTVTGSNGSNNLFNLSGTNTFAYIIGLVFTGLSGTSFAVENSSSGRLNVWDCAMRDCANGVLQSGTGTTEVKRYVINNLSATTTSGIKATSGALSMTDIACRETSDVITAVDISNFGTISKLVDFVAISPNVVTGIKVTDGGSLTGSAINMQYIGNGVVLSGNNTECELDGLKMFDAQVDGFRIEAAGTGIVFSLFSGIILKSGNLNFNVLNSSCVVTGGGYTQLDKGYIHPTARFYAALLDITEGDEGMNIIGELHVGTPLRPAESIVGSGDSHIFEYVYTETTGSVFTDRTAAAVSFSGSTFTFDGITAGNAVYIANRHPMTFEGVKALITTAADLGTGNIVAEYWNGSAWTIFNGSTVQSSTPYLKFAKNYFSQSGSYHIKFNPYIRDTWATNDPVGLGSSYYWIRFRITADIVTAPVIEQIKVHTDRTEINGDGTIEYHMDGRTYKKLVVDAVKPLEGNMQNGSVYVDENVGVGLENNRFTTTSDLLGVSFELPEDCDTSAPIIFVWKGKFATAGNVDFTVRRKIVKPGDAYTNAEPVASGETVIVTTGSIAITADTRQDFRVDLDVSDAIPSRENGFGDEIWITLQYPTRGGDNFDYTKLSANYLSDFNGRHVRQ